MQPWHMILIVGISMLCFNQSVHGLDSEFNQTPAQQQSVDPVVLNGVSVPSDFPFVDITVNDNPDTGYIFINTSWGSDPHYSMILDNTGAPVWYVRSWDCRQDLKVQPDGRLTHFMDYSVYVAMDSTYTMVDTFLVPEGCVADEHDLQVLPSGHYLMIARKDSLIDMSQIVPGGHPEATVTGNSLVEMDENDNPVFTWHCWDNFDIEDAIYEDLRAKFIDYVHMNAIAVDNDGHYLISSRHLSEITKINRHTGEIIWRLGGAHDDFTWTNDTYGISYQHDICALPNGNYTVMDNGTFRFPYFSRALEFSVDTTDWTVTKIWEYPETQNIFTGFMGNVQRLPNGNTLINWADQSLPKLTEVRPDGSKAFELDFRDYHSCYRTFRFPWKGNAAKPYLLIEPESDRITLLFNKFGDPDVAEYRIYCDTQPKPEKVIATTDQPYIHLSSGLLGSGHNHIRVTAVDSQGNESLFSNEEEIFVNWAPGDEMVLNGDFSEDLAYWDWWISEEAESHVAVEDGELHIHIERGGSDFSDISLSQGDIQLIHGRTYQLEFDGYAEAGRIIDFKVGGMTFGGIIDLSQVGYTWLTTQRMHFSYQFVMYEPSETHASIEIWAGTSNHDVWIDNVSLGTVDTDVPTTPQAAPDDFALLPNYPNPFNAETRIRFALVEQSRVRMSIYNTLGRKVRAWETVRNPGMHEMHVRGADLPSGIYYYRLDAQGIQSNRLFSQTRKMVLLK